MLKKSPTAQRKGPLPVILTGKIWNPPVEKQVGPWNFAGLAFALTLGLAAVFFWLFFSGKPQKLPLEMPASPPQATSTTAVLTPSPDTPRPGDTPSKSGPSVAGTIASALPAEAIATVQVKPLVPVAEAPPAIPTGPSPTSVQVAQKSPETPSAPGSTTPPLTVISSTFASPSKDIFPTSVQVNKNPLKHPILLASPVSSLSEISKPTPTSPPVSEPLPLPSPFPTVESPPVPPESTVAEISQDQDISDVPSLKKRSGILMGLRPILQADGWKITWVSRKKGVTCHDDAGNSLNIIPGNKRAFFNGKPVYSPVKPIVTKSGQLFVPIELLNNILDGRLSIVGNRSSSGKLKIRLASAEKKTDQVGTAPTSPSKELSEVLAVRRKGHVMLSLRQVLEADGWTVTWAGMKKAVVCRKGGNEVLVVASGKTKGLWNDRTIKSKRAPILYKERLLVALGTLEKVLNSRISLVNLNRKSNEATIRLAGG